MEEEAPQDKEAAASNTHTWKRCDVDTCWDEKRAVGGGVRYSQADAAAPLLLAP